MLNLHCLDVVLAHLSRDASVADINDDLMAFVEAELKETPDISSKDLFEKAKETHEAARGLTIREFHARYPLQVKRRQALASGGSRRRKSKSRRSRRSRKNQAANRDAVREVLLGFAADLSAAEARKDLVKVLSKIDAYVEKTLEATKG